MAILSAQEQLPKYDPTKVPGASGATSWVPDKQQTVAGQLPGIINSDSPLMQQAETGAKQQMNSRGLLNTSMAVGAAQDAVIKNALPIAQQDATLFANASKYNADTLNELNKSNVAQGYNLDTLGAQQKNRLGELEAQNKYQLEQTAATGQNQISYAQELNKQNIDKMKGTMFETLNKNVNDILNNKDIDGVTRDSNGLTAKDRAINLLQNQFQGQVIAQGIQGIDLSLLNFNKGIPATTTTATTPVTSSTAPAEPSGMSLQEQIDALKAELASRPLFVNGRRGSGS